MLGKIFMFIFVFFTFVVGELFIYSGEEDLKVLGGIVCSLSGVLLIAALEWKV